MGSFFWYDKKVFGTEGLEVSNVYSSLTEKAPKKYVVGELAEEHDKHHGIYQAKVVLHLNPILEGPVTLKPTGRRKTLFKIKVISRDDPIEGERYDNTVKCYERQNNKIKNLKHPHLLKNLILLDTGNKFYIITENAENGSMADLVAYQGFIPDYSAQRYFKQLLLAVCYLHSNGIFHGNINCQNILIDKHNDIKLTGIQVADRSSGSQPKIFNAGPVYYRAPELVRQKQVLYKDSSTSLSEEFMKDLMKKVHKLSYKKYYYCLSDTWSLGVVLFIMLWGVAPFTDEQYKEILKGVYIKPTAKIPSKRGALSIAASAEELYTKMLVPELNLRPRAAEFLNDPWILLGQHDFKEAQSKSFEKGWTDFYKKEFKQNYFSEQKSVHAPMNLAYMRVRNQVKNCKPEDFMKTHDATSFGVKLRRTSPTKEPENTPLNKELYYAVFIPTSVEGGGCMSDFNKHIFSSVQKEMLRRAHAGEKELPIKVAMCYKPYPSQGEPKEVHCRIIWLQSAALGTSKQAHDIKFTDSIISPILGLIERGQLYHAILHKIVNGRPLMKNPKYAILYIVPSAVRSPRLAAAAQMNGTDNDQIPSSLEDPKIRNYLLSIVKDKRRFSAELKRLSVPFFDQIQTDIRRSTKPQFQGFPDRKWDYLELRRKKILELNFCLKK